MIERYRNTADILTQEQATQILRGELDLPQWAYEYLTVIAQAELYLGHDRNREGDDTGYGDFQTPDRWGGS